MGTSFTCLSVQTKICGAKTAKDKDTATARALIKLEVNRHQHRHQETDMVKMIIAERKSSGPAIQRIENLLHTRPQSPLVDGRGPTCLQWNLVNQFVNAQEAQWRGLQTLL